jgi:putative protease
MEMEEDERGTYIMNSKDLNLLDYIDELDKAGVCSFKIEGRMKSEYYLATVVNAYRRAIDAYYESGESYKENDLYQTELKKTAHREFTTAYITGYNDRTVNYDDSQSKGTHKFIAMVIAGNDQEEFAVIEQRNRFKVGDTLEVLSPTDSFNAQITIERLEDEKGNIVVDAKLVQQKLKLFTNIPLKQGDILRIKGN